ncbi:MAG: UvrD-helicase domain-containing protein [Psychrilyobacter sp.]|uniref:UvrD-helicase domain-containing protein n=1 Tax=Psychrilyobacter sp. TaxID=2586924 RepID=UPI003C76A2FA
MKIIIEGDTKSGKTTLLKKKYIQMINNNIDSNKILVLIANRMEAIKFKNNLNLEYSGENRIYSYFGFVQHELNKFWPLVLRKSKKIHKLNITPTFMTFEASQCLMGKTVEYYRKQGFLGELNISNEEISKKFLSNILDASLNNLVYTKIGDKLKAFGEVPRDQLYDQMNIIIDKYMEKTLANGSFDYGTSIYLYNNFLLEDEFYLDNFKNNIEYLLVDSGEIGSIAEVDFINKIKEYLKGIIITLNTDGPYGIHSYSKGYLEKIIINIDSEYKKIKLDSRDPKTNEFLDKLEEKIYSYEPIEGLPNLHLDIENKYKSLNNKKVIKKVLELLDNAVSPVDISVIVPQNDLVLEFALEKISQERGFKYMNIGRNERILDNPYAYILVISSILFYEFNEINLNFDEIKVFFNLALGLDSIRSALLANYIGSRSKNRYRLIDIDSREIRKRIPQQNIEKYDKIRGIFNEIPKDIELYDFFETIYIELIAGEEKFFKNIKGCRELIDSSKKFIETLHNFENIKDLNYEFIKFLRDGAKASESLIELDERLNGEYLSISTPYAYINSGRDSKYQIWTDIRNKNFIPDTKNILQNSWVLSKTWKGNRFSIEDQFYIEKINTMGILRRLMKSCHGDIFVYGSKYSSGSHGQGGLLYSGLKKIK